MHTHKSFLCSQIAVIGVSVNVKSTRLEAISSIVGFCIFCTLVYAFLTKVHLSPNIYLTPNNNIVFNIFVVTKQAVLGLSEKGLTKILVV